MSTNHSTGSDEALHSGTSGIRWRVEAIVGSTTVGCLDAVQVVNILDADAYTCKRFFGSGCVVEARRDADC